MAFTHKTVQLSNFKKMEQKLAQVLKAQVEQAVSSANGRFLRFLDAAATDGLLIQPRWTIKKDSSIAPMHTFHLQELRFGTHREEVEGRDWKWLLTHLDYPHEAKERLLELARVEARAWVGKQPVGKVSDGEKRVSDALQWLFGQPFPKARPGWLTMPGYVHPCELDGFCEPMRLAFEFQGDQHYEAVERYGMNDDALVQRQRTDAWKRHEVFLQKVYLVEVTHVDVPKEKNVKVMAEVLLHKLNGNGTARKFLASVSTPEGIALRDAMGIKGQA
jgi:hypothetical protein